MSLKNYYLKVNKKGGLSMNHNASAQSLITRIEMFIQQENWSSARTYVEQVLDEEPENGYVYFLKMLVERKAKSDEELIKAGRSVTADQNYPQIQLFGPTELVDRVDRIEKQILTNEDVANKNRIYLQAKDYVKENTVESVTKAIECFQSILGWKDADSMIPGLLLKLKDLKYENAYQHMISDDFEQMVKAIDEFKDIINWKDSEAKMAECKERIQTKRDTILTNALKKIDTKKVTKIEKGIDEINDLQYIVNKLHLENGDYSSDIQKCRDAIQTIQAKRMNIGKRVAAGAAALCVAAGGLLFGEYMKTNSEYNSAIALVEAKQYGEAYEIFSNKGFFKDSIAQKASIQNEAFRSQIKSLQTTNIPFGQYEGNDLEWIVLEVSDDKALLISKNVIDYAPFDENSEDVSFEKSTVYKTLNEGLYNAIFTDDQKDIILDTVIETETEENKDTAEQDKQDEKEEVTAKLFLLSDEEIENYFKDGDYKAKNLDGKASNYWLRTMNAVTKDGEIDSENPLAKQNKGIRPAIWIDLELQ